MIYSKQILDATISAKWYDMDGNLFLVETFTSDTPIHSIKEYYKNYKAFIGTEWFKESGNSVSFEDLTQVIIEMSNILTIRSEPDDAYGQGI